MKRIISILLVIALAISCFSLTAFASDENSKVSDSLSAKLEKLTLGEKIETIIWLYSEIDEDEIERKTFLDCGLTAGTCMTLEDVDLYKKTYNRILGEIQSEVNKSFVEKCGVDEKDIVFCSTLSPMIILNLTEEKIYEIANFKEVTLLDYDDSVPVEPSDPIEPSPSETEALVKAKFEAKYSKEIAESESGYLCSVLYANTDENGELEWALCSGSIDEVVEVCGYIKLSKVFLTTGDAEPFGTEFAVYDAEKDDFVLMDEDLSAYEGLEEKMVKLGIAYPIGDADYDRELTINDVTIIQRYLAGLNNEKIDEFLCYVDDDDEISILDATVIQCYLAKICNIDGSKPYSE